MTEKRSDEVARTEQAARLSLAGKIIELRGQPAILANDLADFYGTTTSAINQYRKRNEARFEGFSFELNDLEIDELRSQNVILDAPKYAPWAYTEHGVAMMAMGLRSDEAVELSRVIISTFIDYRRGTLAAERVLSTPGSEASRRKLQTLIFEQMEALLKVRVSDAGATVGDELGNIATSAIEHVKAVLSTQEKKNERITAEVAKLIAESESIYAEARKRHAEAENVELMNMKMRLEILSEFRSMLMQLERDDWLERFDEGFGAGPNPSRAIGQPAVGRLLGDSKSR